jgi:hypothetical protein
LLINREQYRVDYSLYLREDIYIKYDEMGGQLKNYEEVMFNLSKL